MRLIDADALQNILLPIATALEHEYGSLGGAVSGCMKHIDNAPTIDAVPVVRCRECKYSKITHIMKKDILSCENIDVCGEEYLFERNPNDFCSYGERKEGAENR